MMISTDKAVNPTSIMGVSKLVAEMLVQSMAKKSGEILCLTWGNLLRSWISVGILSGFRVWNLAEISKYASQVFVTVKSYTKRF